MEFIFITNDPAAAAHAEKSSVDRIMVDLEQIGKAERQRGFDTLISHHTLVDVARVRRVVRSAKLVVRVNPINDGSKREVDAVADLGADIVLLPMCRSAVEVERFVDYLDGRARSSVLIETPQALTRLTDIVAVSGVNEVYVGLNDLHLAMGLTFMFELLGGGIVEYMSTVVRAAGLTFGFGGIARLGQGRVDSSLILLEHVRLGSEVVILSREFQAGLDQRGSAQLDLAAEICRFRSFLAFAAHLSPDVMSAKRRELKARIKEVVASRTEAWPQQRTLLKSTT